METIELTDLDEKKLHISQNLRSKLDKKRSISPLKNPVHINKIKIYYVLPKIDCPI